MPAFPTQSQLTAEILVEAKRAVSQCANQGQLISPHEAWYLAGREPGSQTLWSIARMVAAQYDVSSEALCDYLENQFPQYTEHPTHSVSWDDLIHKSRRR